MNIKRFVIHELKKEQSGYPDLILSKNLPPITNHATNLLGELSERYKQRETYGRFGDIINDPFPQHFGVYCNEAHTNASFLKFTVDAMNLLKGQLVNSNAKGGYFLFADYATQVKNYVAIFLVRNTEGFIFQNEDQLYDVVPQLHISIEKLAMACKINKDKFLSNGEGNYLSFIRTARQATSEYFINWISATALKKNTEYTDRLIEIIKNIELPKELYGYAEVTRDGLQKTVFNHCRSVANGLVNLADLSEKLYGEENVNKIIDYASEHNMQIDSEFTPDKQKMKKLYRVTVSSKDISLQFDQSSLNDTITIDEDRIIIQSPDLVQKILNEAN